MVFHISKKPVGATFSPLNLPTQLIRDFELIGELEALLDVCTRHTGEETTTEVLLNKGGPSLKHATWKDAEMIKLRFPAFDLEDKVVLWGGAVQHTHLSHKGSPFFILTPRDKQCRTARSSSHMDKQVWNY